MAKIEIEIRIDAAGARRMREALAEPPRPARLSSRPSPASPVFDPGDDRSMTREEYRSARRFARVACSLVPNPVDPTKRLGVLGVRYVDPETGARLRRSWGRPAPPGPLSPPREEDPSPEAPPVG